MSIENAPMLIGPFALAVNLTTMLVFLRPKYGTPFTLGVYMFTSVAGHFQMIFSGTLDSPVEKYMGLLFIPMHMWLFHGQVFQKIFIFFLQHQITALETFFIEMIVGITVGTQSPYALPLFLGLSILVLTAHLIVVLRYGRRLFERIFVNGRRLEWALYALGVLSSYFLIVSIHWTAVGPWLYTAIMLFILWSIGVLCFTIIRVCFETIKITK